MTNKISCMFCDCDLVKPTLYKGQYKCQACAKVFTIIDMDDAKKRGVCVICGCKIGKDRKGKNTQTCSQSHAAKLAWRNGIWIL